MSGMRAATPHFAQGLSCWSALAPDGRRLRQVKRLARALTSLNLLSYTLAAVFKLWPHSSAPVAAYRCGAPNPASL